VRATDPPKWPRMSRFARGHHEPSSTTDHPAVVDSFGYVGPRLSRFVEVSELAEEGDRHASEERGGCLHPPSDELCGYPVVALQVSVLPNCAGQSRSGQGAGSASSPAASEAAR
jgi:hypothetical protein